MSTFRRIALTALCLLSFGLLYAQTEAPLRLAVAGVTHGHLGNIVNAASKGQILIEGVWDASPKYLANNGLRSLLGDDKFYSDLGKMLDEVRPEAVLAYGSTYDHLAVVRQCAPRHIHVMVEKPLATTVRQAEEIQSLADKYGIMVLTNYETSWYETLAYAKKLVDEGKIGKLFRINVYDGHSGPKEIGCSAEFLEWLTDPVLNGGGAVTDFGCYGADIACWLLGGAKPIAVTAHLATNKPSVYPKVDDDATICVEYPEGVIVQIMASWCWPYDRKDMYIYGLDGYIYQRNKSEAEMRPRGGKLQKLSVPAIESPYDNCFSYLAALVRGQISITPSDLASVQTNVNVVKILEAAKKSAKTGKRVIIK